MRGRVIHEWTMSHRLLRYTRGRRRRLTCDKLSR